MSVGCAIMMMSLAWQVHTLEFVHARTTMRLWHELHTERQVSCDFSHLFRPVQDEHFFVGVVAHDELHAIARCRREEAHTSLEGIAHGVYGDEAGEALVRILATGGVHADPLLRVHQPRWTLAHTFHAT